MPDDPPPHQLEMMQQMVDLAVERNRLAEIRTQMAAERTRMAADRTRMATQRTRMAAERTQMAAERTYMAAERTLSVWVRTALGLMAFGVAIDQFGLLLNQLGAEAPASHAGSWSAWGGVLLVTFAVVMVLATGARFLLYVADYRQHRAFPVRHAPFLSPIFALLLAIFGVVLLVLLIFFTPALTV